MNSDKYKEIDKSTLGLTEDDMKELGVTVNEINAEVKAEEKEEFRKREQGILNDHQYFIFSLVILIIGIVVSVVAQVVQPNFTIDIDNAVQFGKLFFQVLLIVVLKFIWLPVLFELFVIVFRKYIGKFYKTWTRATMLFIISALVGMVIIWFNGGF